MLKVFRDNLKHLAWVLWVVIAVFVLLVFVDFGRVDSGGAGATGTAAATVGSQEISYREYQRQHQQLKENARSVYGEAFTPELAEQLGLPVQALESLVAQKILLAEADRLGLRPTEEEIRKAIREFPVFQDGSGNFIGTETYSRILENARYSIAEFEAQLGDEIVLNKLNGILADTLYISAAELEKEYRDGAEKASIRYIQLAPGQLRDEVRVEASELEEYFSTRQEDFRVPEQRSVAYLAFNVHEIQATLEIPDDEIQAYYQSNQQQFTQEEQVRARHILLNVDDENPRDEVEARLRSIRQRVEAGEDFGALAQEFSHDQKTRERGGDLGYFGRGSGNSDFEKAAFGAQVGEVVGPVETSVGPRTAFHLIEVLDHREGGVEGLDQVRERIRAILLTQRSRDAAESGARRAYERAQEMEVIGGDRLQGLAVESGGMFQTTAPFPRDGNVPGIGRDTLFANAAFELTPGQVSEPVRIPTGWAVLSLQEVLEPRLPEFSEVEDKVRETLLQERETEVAKSRLESGRREVEGGKSLDDVAAELGVIVEESPEFGRRGNIPRLGSREVVEAAFSMEAGEVGGPLATPRGPVLFQVKERKHWDPEEFEQNKDATRQRLARQRLNNLQRSLIERRRLELEVHYNPQLSEELGLTTAQF